MEKPYHTTHKKDTLYVCAHRLEACATGDGLFQIPVKANPSTISVQLQVI